MILKTKNVPGIECKDIQPFIFNWNNQFEKNQFEKTCAIEDSLKAIFNKVTVINSDETRTRPGWVDLNDDAYFSAQFRRALELFDSKVLMHVMGDASYHDWGGVVESAQRYYTLYEWGLFAPNVEYSWYSAARVDIHSVELADSNIKICACTDETAWFIHKDIVEVYRRMDLGKCLEHNALGWGWDLVFCALSFLMGRPVIRDYAHTIVHPRRPTGYHSDVASIELAYQKQLLPDTIIECISYISGEREKLAKYLEGEPRLRFGT